MTKYAMGSYQRAAGTRSAFAGLSAALVAEGHPQITVNSGDRETADQEAIFRSKFVPSTGPKDVGPYNDRRLWPGNGYWKRVVGGGTVGVPGTSNHEKRRAADLAPPYNALTAAHRRAQVLAKRFNITCEGLGFSEPWHWTFWGELGAIDSPASGGGSSQEDDMSAHAEALIAEIHAAIGAGGAVGLAEDKTVLALARAIVAQVNGLPDGLAAIKAQVNGAPTILAAIREDIKGIKTTGGSVDVEALATALRGKLAPEIVKALGAALVNG